MLNVRQKQVIAAMQQLDPPCIYYRVKLQPIAMRALFAKMGRGHVGIDNKVNGLVSAIDGMMPTRDFGPTNPNTGSPAHFYFVGRENTRVVYLCMMRHDLPKDYNFDELTSKLTMWGDMHGADESEEVDFPDSPSTQFWFCWRFWWD